MKKMRIISLLRAISHIEGFTLIEMLAAVTVFIGIGTIVVSILVATFRNSSKTNTLTNVRQNGNYAITQMAKTIRNARVLVAPFPCVSVNPTPVSSITLRTSTDDTIIYSCTSPVSPTPATIASNGASLIDTSVASVRSCSFTCTQSSDSDVPLVLIQFVLAGTTSGTFTENSVGPTGVPFQTSVVIRNINR